MSVQDGAEASYRVGERVWAWARSGTSGMAGVVEQAQLSTVNPIYRKLNPVPGYMRHRPTWYYCVRHASRGVMRSWYTANSLEPLDAADAPATVNCDG